ncbi:hypothetical protein FK521_29315, partial [Klebsiella pneumoniae]|nr:hypothetical protein [Klebsiella pneumoniae]
DGKIAALGEISAPSRKTIELNGKVYVSSLEYQYNVSGKWWGAVFVDSGEAVSGRERQAHEAGARTRATAHERTPQQERQKAAREAERGREAWTL